MPLSKKGKNPQYWVVGAMYGGRDDQAAKFIRRGYWRLGYDDADADAPDQAKLLHQIRAGDRIAIKRMMGRGSPEIRITTLGIITEVDEDGERVYVKWVATDLDRIVESRNYFRGIHGPLEENDEWVKEVFHL